MHGPKSALVVIAVVSVLFAAVTAPEVLVVTGFLLGAYWLLRARRHVRGLR